MVDSRSATADPVFVLLSESPQRKAILDELAIRSLPPLQWTVPGFSSVGLPARG